MKQFDAEKKDIRWINYIRAISIILIYYIHAEVFFGYTVQGLAKYILPWYVNAFFFVSGYLFFRKHMSVADNDGIRGKNNLQLVKNIFFRLVVPSILFATVEFLPSSLIQKREISVNLFIEKTVWGSTFWFISALIVAELTLILFLQTRIKTMNFYLVAGFVLYEAGRLIGSNGFLITDHFDSNPWQFEKGLMAILLMVIGGIYWKHESDIDAYITKPIVFFPALAAYIILIAKFHNQMGVLISMNDINAAGVLISMLGILLLVVICKSISYSNIFTNQLNYIGGHTIGLCFLCGSVPKVLMMLLPKILPEGSLTYMLVGFFVSFLLAYAMETLMEKYIPFVFDFRKSFSGVDSYE